MQSRGQIKIPGIIGWGGDCLGVKLHRETSLWSCLAVAFTSLYIYVYMGEREFGLGTWRKFRFVLAFKVFGKSMVSCLVCMTYRIPQWELQILKKTFSNYKNLYNWMDMASFLILNMVCLAELMKAIPKQTTLNCSAGSLWKWPFPKHKWQGHYSLLLEKAAPYIASIIM